MQIYIITSFIYYNNLQNVYTHMNMHFWHLYFVNLTECLYVDDTDIIIDPTLLLLC